MDVKVSIHDQLASVDLVDRVWTINFRMKVVTSVVQKAQSIGPKTKLLIVASIVTIHSFIHLFMKFI